jgi:hypothetical protein
VSRLCVTSRILACLSCHRALLEKTNISFLEPLLILEQVNDIYRFNGNALQVMMEVASKATPGNRNPEPKKMSWEHLGVESQGVKD